MQASLVRSSRTLVWAVALLPRQAARGGLFTIRGSGCIPGDGFGPHLVLDSSDRPQVQTLTAQLAGPKPPKLGASETKFLVSFS